MTSDATSDGRISSPEDSGAAVQDGFVKRLKCRLLAQAFTQLNVLSGLRHYIFSPALYRVALNDSVCSASYGLDLPLRTALAFKAVFLLRSIAGRNDILRRAASAVCDRMEAHLGRLGTEGEVRPVETIDLSTIAPEDFYERFVRDPRPVVIRGARVDVVGRWSVDWFLEHYGEVPVYFALRDRHVKKPLGFFRESNDPEIYLHNSENILFHDPALLEGLHIDRFGPYVRKENFSCQLFLGMRRGTGAPFHCAHYSNLFFNIEGRKKWTFLNPVYTYLMYPTSTSYKAYVASSVGLAHRVSPGRFPLYDRAVRHEVELEPGDVLFSPGWWWHSVENLTERTVAVATRHVGRDDPPMNDLFRTSQILSSRLNGIVRQILYDRLMSGRRVYAQPYALDGEEVSDFERATHSDESVMTFLDRPEMVWGEHLARTAERAPVER
ncbi:Cupin-like domain-containing protein [Tistlia consotensis]|uniref:Cupin-like domain-containing protein n=1 Tax=Tistlia consotensis USBA 355 TaxID=560819 RepID=A0A1Y6CTM0_9PROT|nr:cupin-like domain-containing protein [Tistlia consotensis]SMF73460.1 Cupin-like domain-containing protein [Tistlia consotensis USBA 355]SNS30334.1 Cupin-like domain-containing protein [Tistlia consotensis]